MKYLMLENSYCGTTVKHLPANAEDTRDMSLIPGQEDLLE